MARRAQLGAAAARWGAVAAVVVAVIGTGALVAAAYQHAEPASSGGEAAPVPTFTLGVKTPTPTPTPEPRAATPRESERFLSIGTGAGANVWWRGTAGQCGGTPPLLERSADAGATWTDVTPLYLGAAQLVALDASDQTEAIIVAGVGPGCETQALRTFTQGRFWESSPGILASSRFANPADPASIQLRDTPVAAPCADPRSVRAQADTVALICDGIPYLAAVDQSWAPLPMTDAAALAIDGTDVVVAHRASDCAGLTVSRVPSADPTQPATPTCLENADVATPIAVTAAEAETVVWSGETLTTVP